jgi:hypothetical protein
MGHRYNAKFLCLENGEPKAMSALARLGILALASLRIRPAKRPLKWSYQPDYFSRLAGSNDNVSETPQQEDAHHEVRARRLRRRST